MSVSPDEKRAAFFVLALLIAGATVRLLIHRQDGSGGAVFRPIPAQVRSDRDSLAAQSERLATPLRRGERIDVDQADRAELTRLPRIGPTLAMRIVADRRDRGAFGSLEELGRVSGIGPRVLEGLAPHVQFSAAARSLPSNARRPSRISLNSATVDQLSELPGIGPAKAAAIVEHRKRFGRFSTVNGLTSVSGIGPATVNRLRGLVRVP